MLPRAHYGRGCANRAIDHDGPVVVLAHRDVSSQGHGANAHLRDHGQKPRRRVPHLVASRLRRVARSYGKRA